MADPTSGGVFVSYRRSDRPGEAGWMADRLARHFGKRRVFFDREPHSLAAGDRWADVLAERCRSAEVLVAVIGPDWLVEGSNDRPRIQDEDDWVRREIETALAGDGTVVPVLVGGATIPDTDAVPSSLRALLDQQGVALREASFARDVDDLASQLRPKIRDDRSALKRSWDRHGPIAAGVGVAVATVAVTLGIVARFVIPDPPVPQMDGVVNVAVSDLDDSALPASDQSDYDVGWRISSAIAASIGSVALASAEQGELQVFGPAKTLKAAGDTSADRRTIALGNAQRQNVDLLVYGTVEPGEDGDLERGSVALELLMRGVRERQPAEPAILERIVGRAHDVDLTSFDSADKITREFVAVQAFDDLIAALRALDDDDYPSALASLIEARTIAEDADTDGDDLRVVVETLMGVVYARQAERGVDSALDDAARSFDVALAIDPEFDYARLWRLGVQYLEALGGSLDGAGDPANVDVGALRDVRDGLAAFRSSQDGISLMWIQATNVLGQISMVERGLAADDVASNRFLEEAEMHFDEALEGIDAAGEDSPELDILGAYTRSNKALVEYSRGDFEAATVLYRSAIEMAPPFTKAVERSKLGLVLLQMGQPCAAESELDRALSMKVAGDPLIDAGQAEFLEGVRIDANDQCAAASG